MSTKLWEKTEEGQAFFAKFDTWLDTTHRRNQEGGHTFARDECNFLNEQSTSGELDKLSAAGRERVHQLWEGYAQFEEARPTRHLIRLAL